MFLVMYANVCGDAVATFRSHYRSPRLLAAVYLSDFIVLEQLAIHIDGCHP